MVLDEPTRVSTTLKRLHMDPTPTVSIIVPAYNAANTATMHFNNQCEVKPQLDKELFELVKQ